MSGIGGRVMFWLHERSIELYLESLETWRLMWLMMFVSTDDRQSAASGKVGVLL
jgi:hypothetical protein